jgi:hypothetical protein
MRILVLIMFGSGLWMSSQIQPQPQDVDSEQEGALEEVYQSDFEGELEGWTFVDDGWKHKETADGHVLSLHQKKSNYAPEVRSPTHLAILDEIKVTDFQLDVKILSTHEDYNHRDVCLFFGYQSPTEYYYVHLGKRTDPHANQIFIVNNEARTKISLTTTEGTNWDEEWHQVRIERDVESGSIKVYFDDMENPVMTSEDKTFGWGQIGLGSFDDTADFDDLVIQGELKTD